MYQSAEHLRGVWGLEARAYTEQEVKASPYLQAAVNAGALVRDAEPARGKTIPRVTDAREQSETKE